MQYTLNNDSAWGLTLQIEEQWKEWLAQNMLAENRLLARIISQNHHEYCCVLPKAHFHHNPTPTQIVRARVSGAYRNRQEKRGDFPVVGDWVCVELFLGKEEGIIAHVLPRVGCIRRWAVGDKTREQAIAANLDYILLISGLDGGRNFLSGMIERGLTVARNSGAQPLIVLNKVDCASDETRAWVRVEAESLAQGVPVHLVSAKTLEGIDRLSAALEPGKTVAMLGKSGVGKSALVNAFFALNSESGPQQGPAVEGKLRADAQGRHTTTSCHLYPLPWGAFIIDAPGLRALKIWGNEDDLARAFPDVEALIVACRFRNCSHESEPDCAVQEALEDGTLEVRRYESYKKLQREIQYLGRRQNQLAAREEQQKWKKINMKQHKNKRFFR